MVVGQSSKGRVVVSWTGGKDGCLALYRALQAGYEVSQLLQFRDLKKTGSHALNPALIATQAQALGLPLLQCEFHSYEDTFKSVVCELNEHGAGITGAVFGHIHTHRQLVERICHDLELELLLPLWGRESGTILDEFMDAGFEAVVVSVRADILGREWLGRRLDAEFRRELQQQHPGVALCGENGEYHTLVTDGPLFKQRIKISTGAPLRRDGYWHLAITGYALDCGVGGEKKSMSEEQRIESKQLYAGRVVQLRLDTVTLPDGRLKKREILVHPGAAAIVPVLHNRILLVEQYRTAIGRATLEIPAGTLEVGESPEACARRELIEETGFTAADWQKLTAYYPSPGYSSELIHVYQASGLEKIAAVNAELPLHWLARSEVENRIRTGEIQDSKTIIGVLLAR